METIKTYMLQELSESSPMTYSELVSQVMGSLTMGDVKKISSFPCETDTPLACVVTVLVDEMLEKLLKSSAIRKGDTGPIESYLRCERNHTP